MSSEQKNKPCFFEVIFLHENIRYRYGFEVDKEAVHKEWLYHAPKGQEALLFLRERNKVKLGTYFRKEGNGFIDKTRNNALFLSVVAQFNGPISIKIMNWFNDFRVISGLDDIHYKNFTISKLKDKRFKPDILRFLKIADLGIEDILAEKEKLDIKSKNIPEKLKSVFDALLKDIKEPLYDTKLSAIHKQYNKGNKEIAPVLFDFDDVESEGTKKLFSLSAPIIDTLRTGKVLVADELDGRLHPIMTQYIVKLFNSSQNTSNAQLIFASHDTNMLTNRLFRRDQIWFTEKGQYGDTDLYSLVEYKVRNNASFEKDYILGKYGAIPFIKQTGRLFENEK